MLKKIAAFICLGAMSCTTFAAPTTENFNINNKTPTFFSLYANKICSPILPNKVTRVSCHGVCQIFVSNNCAGSPAAEIKVSEEYGMVTPAIVYNDLYNYFGEGFILFITKS